MKEITIYGVAMGILAFATVIVAGYLMGDIDRNSIYSYLLDAITEKNLRKLMDRAGYLKTSTAVFQVIRIAMAAAVAGILALFGIFASSKGMILGVIASLLAFKTLYFWLAMKEQSRISELNRELPYCITTILHLCHLYPVNNSIAKAIEYVPTIFRDDIECLAREVDENPLSFEPYQHWIDRYEGKLKMLDHYVRSLYRMQQSTSSAQDKTLSNLSRTVSADMRIARRQKNKTANDSIAWIGMAPVVLFTAMLMVLGIAIFSTM